MAKRMVLTPHNDDDGFIMARQHPFIDGFVVLYDGDEAGFDTEYGRWTAFCQTHGSMSQETNKVRATKMLHVPEEWCSECQKMRSGVMSMKIISIDKTADTKEREMRFWAVKAKGSDEKQALFEKMYGVKPDSYWD